MTEATARTLTVHLPPTATAPQDLPREVGAVGGRMGEVVVHGRPAHLLPTAEGWFLQSVMADGAVFVLQAPDDFTPEQVVAGRLRGRPGLSGTVVDPAAQAGPDDQVRTPSVTRVPGMNPNRVVPTMGLATAGG